MKNIFEPSRAAEIKERLARLRPDSVRQWGTMTAPQAIAHCVLASEMAVGDLKPPRSMIGRLIGWIITPMALGNDDPIRRDSPTDPLLVIVDERDLNAERDRLNTLIDRFVTGGPQGVTTHPHSFFGKLTPEQWSILMYKHLDHHLRQFGV